MIRKPNPDQLSLPFEPALVSPEQSARRETAPMHIRVRNDKIADALYVRFSDTPVAETAEVRPGVMFDYDAEGRIVAMEILDASRTVAASDMQKLALEVA